MGERWRQNPRCPANVVAGEAAVVSEREGKLHTLDPVATRIWELLGEEGSTLEAVLEVLEAEYEGDAATIRADTEAFLAEAEAVGIVQRLG